MCEGSITVTHAPLEQAFNESGPFWGRHYLFWHHGQPLTLIYEVFSPYLRNYLGPMEGEGNREQGTGNREQK